MSKPPASRNGRHQPRPGAARGTDTTPKTTGLGGHPRAASRTPQDDPTLDANSSPTAVILTEALVRALVEESPDGIVLVSGSAGIVLVNRQIEQLFGYHRTELLGEPIETLVPNE